MESDTKIQASTEPDDSEERYLASSQQAKLKSASIKQACESRDFHTLVRLADSPGGLLDDELRRSAWPILIGCATASSKQDADQAQWRKLPVHHDEEQVRRDVDRAFVYYPMNEPERVVDGRKKALSNLIVKTLRTHPILCYFQGYHDIVQVLLLVLGEEEAFPCVEQLSLLRIRDYMLPTLAPAIKHLQLLPAILDATDKELAGHLSFTQPYFALSAALTLYAHDIEDYSLISRLFDFILAHEPVMSIYLFAALIISRRSELLEIPLDDQDMLFFKLSKLPQPLNLEPLIVHALKLFDDFPPERLPGPVWHKLSTNSVLKTSRAIDKPQELSAAEEMFRRQAREITRDELLQKAFKLAIAYKRPILSSFATILVGVLSIWIRRSGNDKVLWSLLLNGRELLRRFQFSG